jgi:hypothetical protein
LDAVRLYVDVARRCNVIRIAAPIGESRISDIFHLGIYADKPLLFLKESLGVGAMFQ